MTHGAEHRPAASVEPIVERLGVIGLGLIGSSLAAGARARGLAREVIGWDHDGDVLAAVRQKAW